MSDALRPARHDDGAHIDARVGVRRSSSTDHLTRRAFAFVLAGGRGTRLHQLTDWRAKPAVPFAGMLKIIDFALSNCVNSDKDVIPRLLDRHRVMAHPFADSCVNMVGERPYWRDVGTVDAYWEANIDLVKVVPELNLYDDQWPILSLQPQLPPAKFVFDGDARRGTALDSLVSSGCIVSGATVRRSILFCKVRVGDQSLIEDSVVLPDVVIGQNVTLRRTVVDKRCVLPDGFQAGVNPAHDKARFHVTARGITLITPSMLGQTPSVQARREIEPHGATP